MINTGIYTHDLNVALCIQLDKATGGTKEIGHNLFDRVPQARIVPHIPQVLQAVNDLIGPAVLDPCMHVHLNNSPIDGDWHRDDYCGQPWPSAPCNEPGRDIDCLHPMEFAIVCYYPQDTPPEMGSTEVRMPCDCGELFGMGGAETHYWDCDSLLIDFVTSGPAGTFFVMSHDTEHRATANTTGQQRYMLKFLFRAVT